MNVQRVLTKTDINHTRRSIILVLMYIHENENVVCANVVFCSSVLVWCSAKIYAYLVVRSTQVCTDQNKYEQNFPSLSLGSLGFPRNHKKDKVTDEKVVYEFNNGNNGADAEDMVMARTSSPPEQQEIVTVVRGTGGASHQAQASSPSSIVSNNQFEVLDELYDSDGKKRKRSKNLTATTTAATTTTSFSTTSTTFSARMDEEC